MTRTVPKVQRDESRTQELHRLELFCLLLPGKGNESRNLADHSPRLRDLGACRGRRTSGAADPAADDRQGGSTAATPTWRVTRIARLPASTAHQPPLAAARRDRPDDAAWRADAQPHEVAGDLWFSGCVKGQDRDIDPVGRWVAGLKARSAVLRETHCTRL
jgi:hypothetical protein